MVVTSESVIQLSTLVGLFIQTIGLAVFIWRHGRFVGTVQSFIATATDEIRLLRTKTDIHGELLAKAIAQLDAMDRRQATVR